MTSLYNRYRPTKLEDVIGQDAVVKSLQAHVKKNNVPEVILFAGGSGTGKSTLAKVLVPIVGCSSFDYHEYNCATVESPLGMVQEVERLLGMAKRGGKAIVWHFEEIGSMSRAKHAQEGLLKLLEFHPPGEYFFLTTTDPDKVLRAIRGRCTRYDLKPIPVPVLTKLVKDVAVKEKAKLPDAVAMQIAQTADGSAREALVLLEKALALSTESDQLDAVLPPSVKQAAFGLVQAMIYRKSDWKAVAAILRDLEDDPEQVRNYILACATTEILKADPRTSPRAALVLGEFERNFFDGKRASLVRAVYDVIRMEAR